MNATKIPTLEVIWNITEKKWNVVRDTDGMWTVVWAGYNKEIADQIASILNGYKPATINTYELLVKNTVKEPVQYISIVEEDPEILTKRVNEKLKVGWKLRGHTVATNRNSLVHYLQVLR